MMRIESRDNPRVKRIARILTSASARREEGGFVCEGPTILAEAMAAGADIREVYALPQQAEGLPESLRPRAFEVTPQVLSRLSDVETPRGPVFLCAIPPDEGLQGRQLIAAEDLRDPGNLGTVLRTAEALGLCRVALCGSCVDRYSPKAVRASMGSIFRVRTCAVTSLELRQWTRAQGIPLYGAALTPGAKSIGEVDLAHAAVLIGSEAHGLRPETLALCDSAVVIPISGAESLNAAVAAAIFLWEMKRARI